MDRLGIWIIIFLWLGFTFFERARTQGQTGSFWKVLRRNLIVFLLAVVGFLAWGFDIMYPGEAWQPGTALRSIFSPVPPYGMPEDSRWYALILTDTLQQCFLCGIATLIVSVSLWELAAPLWFKILAVALFNLLLYPLLGSWHWGGG
ncbi:MAG: hypothetical protein AAF226_06415, partial [Verrucomicrobiota bacterium]